MGLSTVLRFGLDVYEAYDDGIFDGVIGHFAYLYPEMSDFISTSHLFGYHQPYGYSRLNSMYF